LEHCERKIFREKFFFENFSLDFRSGCSKLAVALKTRSLLLAGMGKIKEPTPSNWELSSARVLHAPIAAR
jgi:hypothetical protein